MATVTLPRQMEGKKKFKLVVTERTKAEAIVHADTEKEAWDKAEKLAQYGHLETFNTFDMVGQEVDKLEEYKEDKE